MSDYKTAVSVGSSKGTPIGLSPGSDYNNYIHIMGRITLSLGFLLSVLPPLLLWLSFGIFPPLKNLATGIFNITVLMLPVSIVEVLTFAPILGAGALYMAYLTGNLTNLKIPCAATAIEAVEVKPSTPEGDIIANIAIAGSVLAYEFIIVIGVLLIIPVATQLNNPAIKPAFDQILPALFGAIGAFYILKEWRLAVAPLISAILLSFVHQPSITIPVCVVISILAARFMYKKNWIKSSEKIEG
jgi:hypothetical protein